MPSIDILLFGKGGFLGSHIFDALKKRDINIISFSIRNKDDYLEILKYLDNQDRKFTVINASWKDTKVYNPSELSLRDNFEIQVNLLKLMQHRNILRFINFGTYNEYGKLTGLLSEDLVSLSPISNYAKLKYAIFKAAISMPGAKKYLHLRISNIYGEKQDPKSLYGSIVNFNKKSEDLIIFRDLKIYRDYLHVNLFCDIIFSVLLKNCLGILNVGSGITTSHYDFIIEQCRKYEIPIEKILFQNSELDHEYMSSEFVLCTSKLKNICPNLFE